MLSNPFFEITGFLASIGTIYMVDFAHRRHLGKTSLMPSPWCALLIILLISGASVFYFYPQKPKLPLPQINGKLADTAGLVNEPESYLNFSNETALRPGATYELATLRRDALQRVLLLADDSLRRLHMRAYGLRLYAFLADDSETGRRVAAELRNKFYIYIDEKIDKPAGLYHLGISISKTGAVGLDSLTDIVKSAVCFDTAIDRIVIVPLQSQGNVEIYFFDIFNAVCDHCPGNLTVTRWRTQLEGGGLNGDSLYFDRSKFHLSMMSYELLTSLRRRLAAQSMPVTVVFRGSTDSSPFINDIPYNDGAACDSGKLLPNPTAPAPMSLIDSNIKLSFARAYSCYKELPASSHIKTFYTGIGVNHEVSDPRRQRSVKIIITKN